MTAESSLQRISEDRWFVLASLPFFEESQQAN